MTRRSEWFVTKILLIAQCGPAPIHRPHFVLPAALLRPVVRARASAAIRRRAVGGRARPSATSLYQRLPNRARHLADSEGRRLGLSNTRTARRSGRCRGWFVHTSQRSGARDAPLPHDFEGLQARYGGVVGDGFVFPRSRSGTSRPRTSSRTPSRTSGLTIQGARRPGALHRRRPSPVRRALLAPSRAHRRTPRRRSPRARGAPPRSAGSSSPTRETRRARPRASWAHARNDCRLLQSPHERRAGRRSRIRRSPGRSRCHRPPAPLRTYLAGRRAIVRPCRARRCTGRARCNRSRTGCHRPNGTARPGARAPWSPRQTRRASSSRPSYRWPTAGDARHRACRRAAGRRERHAQESQPAANTAITGTRDTHFT